MCATLLNSLTSLANKRILVIEDHVDVRQLLILLCEAAGAAVYTAASRADAFKCMDLVSQENDVAGGAAMDLAIVDIRLPDGDGRDLIRTLREAGHAFPILVFTASSTDKVSCVAAGCDDYLVKPGPPSQLLQMAAEHLCAKACDDPSKESMRT